MHLAAFAENCQTSNPTCHHFFEGFENESSPLLWISEEDSLYLYQGLSDGSHHHPNSGRIYHRAHDPESSHLYTCLLYCYDRQNENLYEIRVRNYGVRYTFVRL